PQDEPLLKQLGAETVVPRHPGPADRSPAGGRYRRAVLEGVDALVDAAVLGEPVLDAVRDGGAVVTCRPGPLEVPRGIVRHEVNVMAYPDKAAALTELAALAGAGLLSVRTAALLAPSAAPQAHRRLAAGRVRRRPPRGSVGPRDAACPRPAGRPPASRPGRRRFPRPAAPDSPPRPRPRVTASRAACTAPRSARHGRRRSGTSAGPRPRR